MLTNFLSVYMTWEDAILHFDATKHVRFSERLPNQLQCIECQEIAASSKGSE